MPHKQTGVKTLKRLHKARRSKTVPRPKLPMAKMTKRRFGKSTMSSGRLMAEVKRSERKAKKEIAKAKKSIAESEASIKKSNAEIAKFKTREIKRKASKNKNKPLRRSKGRKRMRDA